MIKFKMLVIAGMETAQAVTTNFLAGAPLT
jgi:hypothetical protein